MASEEWSKRVVSALHALGKRRFGALTEAEKKAQVFPSYVRKRKDAGTIDLRKMLAVLEALNEHPARFFRRVFPGRENDYRTFVETPTGPQPDIIEHAQRRLSSNSSSSIPRSHLKELDRLRYDEPQKAADRVLTALEFIAPNDVLFALGVWASAQRLLINFDDAIHALLAALEIADTQQDLSARGDLLQRLAAIVYDHGDYADALTIASAATDTHARSGNLEAVGQTLVERGLWLFCLNRHDESIAMSKQGLPLLAQDDQIHRATAWQDIGLNLHALGQFDEAAQAIREAWKSAGSIGSLNQSKLKWAEAVIDFSRGAYLESERKLSSVVATFAEIHRGEAALAAIDLAEVQLTAGKPAVAYASAHAILPLITKLCARSRIIRAAESQLADTASRGAAAMTIEAVENLRTLIKTLKREHHLWRSLRT